MSGRIFSNYWLNYKNRRAVNQRNRRWYGKIKKRYGGRGRTTYSTRQYKRYGGRNYQGVSSFTYHHPKTLRNWAREDFVPGVLGGALRGAIYPLMKRITNTEIKWYDYKSETAIPISKCVSVTTGISVHMYAIDRGVTRINRIGGSVRIISLNCRIRLKAGVHAESIAVQNVKVALVYDTMGNGNQIARTNPITKEFPSSTEYGMDKIWNRFSDAFPDTLSPMNLDRVPRFKILKTTRLKLLKDTSTASHEKVIEWNLKPYHVVKFTGEGNNTALKTLYLVMFSDCAGTSDKWPTADLSYRIRFVDD